MLHTILIAILITSATTSCSNQQLNYERRDKQSDKIVEPTMIVINGTSKSTLLESTLFLGYQGYSTHYIIDTDGSIYETLNTQPRLVKEINKKYLEQRARHIGHGYWKTDHLAITDINSHSIGLSFVNQDCDNTKTPHRFNVTLNQFNALTNICKQLKEAYSIEDKNIIGHHEITINKATKSLSPGSQFPWKLLAQENIGLYHNLTEEELCQTCNSSITSLQQSLLEWGYSVEVTEEEDEQTVQALLQAQTHHDPEHIDGYLQSCRIPRIIANLQAHHRAKK